MGCMGVKVSPVSQIDPVLLPTFRSPRYILLSVDSLKLIISIQTLPSKVFIWMPTGSVGLKRAAITGSDPVLLNDSAVSTVVSCGLSSLNETL